MIFVQLPKRHSAAKGWPSVLPINLWSCRFAHSSRSVQLTSIQLGSNAAQQMSHSSNAAGLLLWNYKCQSCNEAVMRQATREQVWKQLYGGPSKGLLAHDLYKGCFTIKASLQKLHSSPVLTVEAYFDFKVLLPKHWSGLGLPTAIKRRLESINF